MKIKQRSVNRLDGQVFFSRLKIMTPLTSWDTSHCNKLASQNVSSSVSICGCGKVRPERILTFHLVLTGLKPVLTQEA